MSEVEIWLRDYKPFEGGEDADPVYRLRLTYQALSYFALLNMYEFTLPVYFLLFLLVSLVLILIIIFFWLLNLQCATYKTPPQIRFRHMVRVTLGPPLWGAFLASVPSLLVAFSLSALQGAMLFSDVSADWTTFGGDEISPPLII